MEAEFPHVFSSLPAFGPCLILGTFLGAVWYAFLCEGFLTCYYLLFFDSGFATYPGVGTWLLPLVPLGFCSSGLTLLFSVDWFLSICQRSLTFPAGLSSSSLSVSPSVAPVFTGAASWSSVTCRCFSLSSPDSLLISICALGIFNR